MAQRPTASEPEPARTDELVVGVGHVPNNLSHSFIGTTLGDDASSIAVERCQSGAALLGVGFVPGMYVTLDQIDHAVGFQGVLLASIEGDLASLGTRLDLSAIPSRE
jgi:hypothetical protein